MTDKTVRLVEPRGFCFGVKRALKVLEEAIYTYPQRQIYVVNEIVHNKTIIDFYRQKGIIFTQDIDSVAEKSPVVFSAHGVAPSVRKFFQDRQNIILDATCPKVQKVHEQAAKLANRGQHIIYIADPNHDEAKGVIAQAQGNISVVHQEADITSIPKGLDKYTVLTQTTLNLYEVEEIYQKIKKIFPEVDFPERNNLCSATTQRQLAVERISKECDLMLILGSVNSSNSQRLKDIATLHCLRAFLIDSHLELNPSWLQTVNRIGITAGASAPEYLVEDLVAVLLNYGYQLI